MFTFAELSLMPTIETGPNNSLLKIEINRAGQGTRIWIEDGLIQVEKSLLGAWKLHGVYNAQGHDMELIKQLIWLTGDEEAASGQNQSG